MSEIIRRTLTYETFSREAAVSRLREDGVVSVQLGSSQMKSAVRVITKLEEFHQGLGHGEGVIRLVVRSVVSVWSVSLLVLLHGKLAGLVPFVVLNKPHAWCEEVGPNGISCLLFLAHR